jgi:putative SOS response-associated peptidase YedK
MLRMCGRFALYTSPAKTVAARASFPDAFRERRIIVSADGFSAWRKTKTDTKQPHSSHYGNVHNNDPALIELA